MQAIFKQHSKMCLQGNFYLFKLYEDQTFSHKKKRYQNNSELNIFVNNAEVRLFMSFLLTGIKIA